MKSPQDGIVCSEFDGVSFDTSYEAFWHVWHTVHSDFICHSKFHSLTPFFPYPIILNISVSLVSFLNLLNRLDTSLICCVGTRNSKPVLKKDLESAECENDCPGQSWVVRALFSGD